jgi:hypothetical protein
MSRWFVCGRKSTGETKPGELAEHAGATRKEVNTRKLYSEGREDDLASVRGPPPGEVQ